ncbi:T9SS type A sorting domain-containing protein [bacterium]|nr:T9SS type A sorting domain-containing protein [bacterium]
MQKRVIGILAGIVVFAVMIPGLNAQIVRDTVYRQNFDSTWSTTSPPTNWQIIYDSPVDANDWNRATRATNNYMAYIYYYPSTTATDRMISPTLDCSDPQYTSVWLKVWHYYNYYGGGYTAQIRGSNDNGSTFPNIIRDYNNASYGPATDIFDITSFALGQNDVRIDFYGNGYIWNINYWEFDDFIVYGEWVVIDTGGNLDLEMSAIIRPFEKEVGGEPFTPTCKVFSNSEDQEPADIQCKITRLSDYVVVYDKVLQDFPLDPGYNTIGAFQPFTPDGGESYKALFVVSNPEDTNENNNNLERRFDAELGEQVSPIQILSPDSNQFNNFSPEARFAEQAGTQTDAWLHYQITGPLMALMEDSVSNTFNAYDTFDAKFGDIVDLGDGDFTIRFWATNKAGASISKPELGMSLGFKHTAVSENPEPLKNSLSVSGNVVSFSLKTAGSVSLNVYDAAGNLVETLASGSMTAGTHTATLNARPGVYFVKLVTADYTSVRKAVLLY